MKGVLWLWIEPLLRFCLYKVSQLYRRGQGFNSRSTLFFSGFLFATANNVSLTAMMFFWRLSSFTFSWEIIFPYLWKHPSCVPHRQNPKFLSLNQRMMFHHQQNTLFLWYNLPKFDLSPGQKNFLSLMRRNIKWLQTATERMAAIRLNLWCIREYFGLRKQLHKSTGFLAYVTIINACFWDLRRWSRVIKFKIPKIVTYVQDWTQSQKFACKLFSHFWPQ